MAAGLPSAEFWIQTPGLYALHLRGVAAAEERRAMEIRSAAYLTALLIRQQTLPPAQDWITGKRDRAAEIQRWTAAWDRIDAAFARRP